MVQFGFETVGWFGGRNRGGRGWGRVWARGNKNPTEAAMALLTEVGGNRYSVVGSDLSHQLDNSPWGHTEGLVLF